MSYIVDFYLTNSYSTGLHNFAHPRTDAVVITVVTNAENDKILLGRNVNQKEITSIRRTNYISQRKWPGRFYSALAGFIEPGEALEDAVKRELWEEAGVKVWGVKYHSTQPWVWFICLSIRQPVPDRFISALPCQSYGWLLRRRGPVCTDTNRFRQ